MAIGWHTRGYIPHFDAGSAVQSVTFRLAGSLPSKVLEAWRAELEQVRLPNVDAVMRRKVDEALDRGDGAQYLADSRVARVVEEVLLHFHGVRYNLHAWCLMPNHVHVLVAMHEASSLSSILHTWKSYSAKRANAVLGRSGVFWAQEYFDRFIRNEEHYESAVRYIQFNPVKAGLCRDPADWRFSSCWRGYAGVAGGTPALPGMMSSGVHGR
jgi:putative DNA methylase